MTIEITDWLRKLGLEQYAPAFLDNAIDSKVLPRLTAEDLKDLGVTMVGHRRRLLDAIAALTDEAPAAVVEPTSPDAAESTDAERRQVTVMFCDLVGSTALSTRIDPEDLQEVIGGYQGAVTEAVIGFGGFVAKYMGDGVLVYFGYPQAHRTTPNGPYGPDCERSRLSVCSDPSNSRYESASPADRWWSAI